MNIKLPHDLPADPAAAYRKGVRDGMKAAITKNVTKAAKARAAALTPERRKEISRLASAKRWPKEK
jgi:hypothetical protein